MNPDETFAADRSPFSSKMDFLSQLFALGGFEGLLLSAEKKLLGHVILSMMKAARGMARVAIKPFNDL